MATRRTGAGYGSYAGTLRTAPTGYAIAGCGEVYDAYRLLSGA
jgi:hypothetical protein